MDQRWPVLVEELLRRGYVLTPGALDLLKDRKLSVDELIASIPKDEENKVFITEDEIHHLLLRERQKKKPRQKKKRKKGIDMRIRLNPGDLITSCEGTVENFHNLFLDRLEKLRRILLKRNGLTDSRRISDVKKEGNFSTIGIVRDKRETSKGYVIEIEDETGSLTFFAPKGRDSSRVVLDEVIGVSGTIRGRRAYAERIYFPEIPRTNSKPKEKDLRIAFISDIHAGSKQFKEILFMDFVNWISEGSIDVLIMTGDLVDGIGVYPNQEDELRIKGIREQYEKIKELLSSVDCEIIAIPGNHDATRPMEPQPAFQEEIVEPLSDLGAVILGNPSWVEIHGVKILLYHGRGLDDLITVIPEATHEDPTQAVLEVLRKRHLAPIYGGKTPIAPESKDLLVIDEVPHVLHMGHVHVNSYVEYRGVKAFTSGTWQEQTSFQRAMGIKPVLGEVPILDLSDFRIRRIKIA